MTLATFRDQLNATTHKDLQSGLIGEGAMIPGLRGDVPLVYADYVASGRALSQVEDYVRDHVLPFYANSHTEASFCGAYMTRLREAARAEIAAQMGAGEDHAVIFTGSGATSGLNRLVSLLGVNEAANAVVFIGPYEHHSNILPWRESAATVVEIPEATSGGPDLEALQSALRQYADADVKIGSFSAASNVTGIVTETGPVTTLLKSHGALALWDYAGGGPYLPMSMSEKDGAQKDAIVVSPHKFPGGPGASGLLVVRRDAIRRNRPSQPGGGTVSFVSPWAEDYSQKIEAREEAGTPNVIGDIRAALAFMVKAAVGPAEIAQREAAFHAGAMQTWSANPHINILGHPTAHRLPIFSMRITNRAGAPVHQQLFTRMLSDIYGIQARGGCACAGPYAHRLLGIDQAQSKALRVALNAGEELEKPGWVRLNFGYLMSDETAEYIIDSVDALARETESWVGHYGVDPKTARFKPAQQAA